MRKKIWLRGILPLVGAVLAGSAGLTRFLQTSGARQYLIAKLEASFGRQVEVSRFGFSVLDGGRLVAHSLTVSEDSRFGNEYFLRADSLTVGLRWPALLSGRFEFGTLSLSEPSLNLVRDSRGRWNIEDWLPPSSPSLSQAGFVGPREGSSNATPVRFVNIVVEGGRINFKQGEEKSPFALLDVSGRVAQDGSGRWQLDLAALPMRAGVNLQEIGTVRLRGAIAGTSARLQPADLNLTWRQVSLADALRIVRQSDFGVRGELDVELNAHVNSAASLSREDGKAGGGQWKVAGMARMRGIHGWQLPQRSEDPALNISFEASWRLGERHAQVGKILVEMPQSHIHCAGEMDWAEGFRPDLHIQLSSLGLRDIFSFYRAFRPGVPENLDLAGAVGIDATLSGWPPRLQEGVLASTGARLSGASLPADLQIGEINASVAQGGLEFAPTEISFAAPAARSRTETNGEEDSTPNSFMMRGAILPYSFGVYSWPPNWNFSVEGETAQVQDWLILAKVLTHPLAQSLTAAGGLVVKLSGTRRVGDPSPTWLGILETRNLTVNPAFLNRPLVFPKSQVEFTQSQRTITLTAAEAFGATWHGAVTRKMPAGGWVFDVSANRLDAAELDRWLGPRARPSFLSRITSLGGFGANPADSQDRDSTAARISARGRLRAAEFDVAPFQLGQLDADVELAGRRITVQRARADFLEGRVSATLDAKLSSDPSYHFKGQFDRVNLALLGRAVPSLRDRFIGIASGDISLTTHGVGRENLAHSIVADGMFEARNAVIVGLDLSLVTKGSLQSVNPAKFTSAKGKFSFANGEIEISDFVLDQAGGRLQADGRIDLSRSLDIRIRPVVSSNKPAPGSSMAAIFSLGGTLDSPKWTPLSPVADPPARTYVGRK